MSNNVDITIAADDKSAQKALDQLQGKLDKTERKLEKMRHVSRQATDQTTRGFSQGEQAVARMGAKVTSVLTGLLSFQKLVQAIGREWDETARKQDAARVAALEPAQAIREARIAFVPDQTLGDAQLDQVVQDLANETRSSVKNVAVALQTAFSAKGSQTNQVAVDAVRQALRMDPSNPNQAAVLAGRFLDVAKFSGSTDIQANAGFIQNVQSASRVTTSEKVGANIVPAIGGMTFLGDTPEQGAELLAAATQLLGDEQGRISANAVLTLGNQLKGFVPQKATKGKFKGQYVANDMQFGEFAIPAEQFAEFERAQNTQERIEVMQRNDELRKAFISTASFQTKPEQQMLGLLRADPRAVEELRQARDTIKGIGPGQRTLFEEKIAQLEGGALQANLTAQQEMESNIESGLLANTPSQRIAFARKSVEETLSKIDRPGVDWPANSVLRTTLDRSFGLQTNALAQGRVTGPPELLAARVLESIKTDVDETFTLKSPMSLEDQNLLRSQIRSLRKTGMERGNMAPPNMPFEGLPLPLRSAGQFAQGVQNSLGGSPEMAEMLRKMQEIADNTSELKKPTAPRQTARPTSRLSRGSN